MTAQNPPGYLQNRTDHPAKLMRQVIKALRSAGVANATDMAVSLPGGMFVRVAAGGVFMAGTESVVDQGTYYGHNDANVDLVVQPAHATLSRFDRVYAAVRDQAYSGVSNDWVLGVAQGTPAASPAEPALPANAVELARITVAAAATVPTALTDRRVTAGLPPIGAWTPFSVTAAGSANFNPGNGVQDGAWRRLDDKTAEWRWAITLGTTSTITGTASIGPLPFTCLGGQQVAPVLWFRAAGTQHAGVASLSGTQISRITLASLGYLSNTVPAAAATGDIIRTGGSGVELA